MAGLVLFFLGYVAFVFVFMAVPAALGFSFGIRNFYIAVLLKLFEKGRKVLHSKLPHKQSVGVIAREGTKFEPPRSPIPRNRSFGTFQREFHMADALLFYKSGVESIIDDEVTKCFSAEELATWNLLTRNNMNYHHMSKRLTFIWVLGCIFRYTILFPTRLIIVSFGMSFLFLSTAIVSQLPHSNFRRRLDTFCTLTSFRVIGRAISIVVSFHNKENMAQGGGICVANHTSPIDVLVLACDRCYSLVGQRQPGLFGLLERTLAKTQDHIWFERSEMKDRLTVTKRLREHVEDSSKNPILIFPEGTCINNTSVMMFKKGSFEIGGLIYPVAIKYDPTFGDAFWNSSEESFGQYVLTLLTNWALVCDVWYLPPMERQEDESAVTFANRVKTEIARQGGLVDLIWDGQLKRTKVKPEFRQQKQEDYASTLKID